MSDSESEHLLPAPELPILIPQHQMPDLASSNGGSGAKGAAKAQSAAKLLREEHDSGKKRGRPSREEMLRRQLLQQTMEAQKAEEESEEEEDDYEDEVSEDDYEDEYYDKEEQDYETSSDVSSSSASVPGEFHCQICSKTYQRQDFYERHLNTHDPAKVHEMKNALPKIKRQPREIGENGEKQLVFECPTCGKTFKQKFHMQVHMTHHSGLKPFECPICGKGFPRKDAMEVHMLTHSNERNFPCDVCGAAFKLKGHLTRHMFTHLEKVDIQCDICGKVFARIDQFNNHLKHAHLGQLQ